MAFRFAYLIRKGQMLSSAASDIGGSRAAVEDHRDVVRGGHQRGRRRHLDVIISLIFLGMLAQLELTGVCRGAIGRPRQETAIATPETEAHMSIQVFIGQATSTTTWAFDL